MGAIYRPEGGGEMNNKPKRCRKCGEPRRKYVYLCRRCANVENYPRVTAADFKTLEEIIGVAKGDFKEIEEIRQRIGAHGL